MSGAPGDRRSVTRGSSREARRSPRLIALVTVDASEGVDAE